MKCTLQTANGLATYHSADFRTYAPETTIRGGEHMTFQLCESYEGGRWEGFVSVKTPKALRRAVGKAQSL